MVKNSNQIFIIGPNGSGKSTVGPLVAKLLNRPFLDQDRLFNQIHGMSIGQFFTLHGVPAFFVANHRLLQGLCASDDPRISDAVISLSPSAILNNGFPQFSAEAQLMLKDRVVVALLPSKFPDVNVDQIWGRIKNRPWAREHFDKAKYRGSMNKYRRIADIKIHSERRNPQKTAQWLVKNLRKEGLI